MAVWRVSVCPSSPWSQGNCFGQWRSKVWTAAPTAWTSRYRETETQKIRLNVSKADINDPFGRFFVRQNKQVKQELFLAICHLSLTFYSLLIEKS